MQKLFTVTVNAKQLIEGAKSNFKVEEVEGVNEFLEQGWQIEEWNFLKEEAGSGLIILMVILNDSTMFIDQEELSEDFYMEEELDELEKEQLL
jgi:hypothetical protein